MLNYTNPFTKYFYEVSSAIQDGIYIVNHLNFNPADMETHNGVFLTIKLMNFPIFLNKMKSIL
jgi:hypothetical protein